MKEIVIKIPDHVYEHMIETEFVDLEANQMGCAIRKGKVLPKGHGELGDTKALIQDVVRDAERMKDNGIAPVFDAHEITNLILSQDVIVDADKGEE